MPCCSALHCEKCIFSKGRCPKCGASFDLKDCKLTKQMLKLGDVLIKCRYEGCEYRTSDILITEHEKSCKKATVNPALVELFMDPSQTPESIAKQRTLNILLHFKEFDNVQDALRRLSKDLVFQTENSQDEKVNQYYIHMVLDTDTLQGIAIKYGCSVQEIRELNQLRSNIIHERVSLQIPHKRDNVSNDIKLEDLEKLLESKLIHKFKRQAKCTLEEAKYYLDEANMEFSKAFIAFAGDSEWSKSANPPFSPSIPLRKKIEHSKTLAKSKRVCCSLFSLM